MFFSSQVHDLVAGAWDGDPNRCDSHLDLHWISSRISMARLLLHFVLFQDLLHVDKIFETSSFELEAKIDLGMEHLVQLLRDEWRLLEYATDYVGFLGHARYHRYVSQVGTLLIFARLSCNLIKFTPACSVFRQMTGITGNLAKFALGFATIFFDVSHTNSFKASMNKHELVDGAHNTSLSLSSSKAIFFTQHYVLYPSEAIQSDSKHKGVDIPILIKTPGLTRPRSRLNLSHHGVLNDFDV